MIKQDITLNVFVDYVRVSEYETITTGIFIVEANEFEANVEPIYSTKSVKDNLYIYFTSFDKAVINYFASNKHYHKITINCDYIYSDFDQSREITVNKITDFGFKNNYVIS